MSGVAVMGVVEVYEGLVLVSEMLEAGEHLGAKKLLSHTSLKCSTTPLRHGSRSGMNRGVTPRSKHVATTGPKYW